METGESSNVKKSHRERQSGRKADKKKAKTKHVQDQTAKERNPKAFAFHSIVKTQRKIARGEDLKSKKHHIPVVSRTPLEPAPVIVAIVGGRKVGKSVLLRSLIKKYTKQKLTNINGPVTVVTGKKQRLTFIEVNNDISSMVDIAKVADVVLMLVDITIGIEMEVFEFLEICRSYGMPRVMGVLNHLDLMKDSKALRKRRKELVHRFQVELYPGAKLFYLSGIIHEEYPRMEVNNLARFISVLKFRPLHFRSTHSYVLVDRMEDITGTETIRENPVCNRSIVFYGYVRGIPMQPGQHVHIPGVGDHRIKDISILDDPCPLPDKLKKRSLNAKERLLYAPMSGVSGVVYDKDAIYIDLGGSHHGRNTEDVELAEDERDLMQSLLHLQKTADEKTAESEFKLFSHSQPIKNEDVQEDEDPSESENEEDDDSEHEGEGDINSDVHFEAVRGEDGTIRRRVVFQDESAKESDIESDEDMEDSTDEESEEDEQDTAEKVSGDELTDNMDTSDQRVKQHISVPGFEKSQAITTASYINYLQSSIYGRNLDVPSTTSDKMNVDEDDSEDDLFTRTKSRPVKSNQSSLPSNVDPNGTDTAKLSRQFKDWSADETKLMVRDCFVSGEWSAKESAEKLLQMDDEDADLYGDFEDLESGEKFNAPKEETDTKSPEKEVKKKLRSEMTAQEVRLEKKRRLKEMFDAEFDEKGKGDAFDALKEEMNEQSELNRTQFEGLDDETRVKFEGFRAGLYVRMEFDGMPCELVNHFDASHPLIIGGLLDSELNMGYVRARIKVHRWFPRILKNRDPLYMSIGWRRFQTMMFYAKREDNFRLRSLKYARKFLHVEAVFWGPVAETSSGFVAFQNIKDKTSDFSVTASGVILESDKSSKLVKKLKLIGYPEKIHFKTSFIKGMFHSDTEVTKFEGTKLQTQSSIRGVIKKSVGLDGNFRATFENQIKMSDVVFLTTWAPVEVAKFCSYVKNLLLPIGQKNEWEGMKTNWQLKREKNIKNLPNPDSLYTPITERREHVSLPMKLPKALQEALPYKCKPKIKIAGKKKQRVVVVKDPEEVKMKNFMSQLRTVMHDKQRTQKMQEKKQRQQFKDKIMMAESLRQMREKKRKAFACKRKSTRKSKSLT